jgi:hypothetical protein
LKAIIAGADVFHRISSSCLNFDLAAHGGIAACCPLSVSFGNLWQHPGTPGVLGSLQTQ